MKNSIIVFILIVTMLLIGCSSSVKPDTASQNTPPQDTSLQDAPPQDSPPQDSSPQDSSPQDSPPQDTPPQDSSQQDSPPQGALEQDSGLNKLSINFTPYIDGDPELGDEVPDDVIHGLLQAVSPFCGTLRTFGATNSLYNACLIGKTKYNMRVYAGCWLGIGYSAESVKRELDALVALGDQKLADILVVGSETMYREEFSPQQLAEWIEYVRGELRDKSIPITTSDTAAKWLEAPQELLDAADCIMFTYYPYFERTRIDDASGQFMAMFERLQAKFPSHPIICSETGWPDEGRTANGKAVPSVENAAKYFLEVIKWSQDTGNEVVYFSMANEKWKEKYLDIEGHFGLLDGYEIKPEIAKALSKLGFLPTAE